jgi:hypothetical protein
LIEWPTKNGQNQPFFDHPPNWDDHNGQNNGNKNLCIEIKVLLDTLIQRG